MGVFGLEFEKIIVVFEISALEFTKNEFLTIIVNFGTVSAFSLGPGSTFSEYLGPSLGPLKKYALFLGKKLKSSLSNLFNNFRK